MVPSETGLHVTGERIVRQEKKASALEISCEVAWLWGRAQPDQILKKTRCRRLGPSPRFAADVGDVLQSFWLAQMIFQQWCKLASALTQCDSSVNAARVQS